MEADEVFMSRCLQLAALGAGNVAPNPMVGCVITIGDEAAPYGQRIIGEGYHQQFGGPHAEVNAVAAVRDPNLLRKARVYVNLEPCSHLGKTPPCTRLLIEKEIPEVVIGCEDPHKLVAGSGISALQKAGCTVKTGVLEKQSIYLNRRFFTWHQKQRPYILLKWAQTSDGFIARKDYSSKWISNQYSRAFVHKFRSTESAIMVGTRTALFDDPALNVRNWSGKDPLRIVIDRQLKIPASAQIFAKTGKIVIFNEHKNGEERNVSFRKIAFGEDGLAAMLNELFNMKVLSVLVEGGAALLNSFIEKDLWDEARVFTAPVYFTEGIPAPVLSKTPVARHSIDHDVMNHYLNL